MVAGRACGCNNGKVTGIGCGPSVGCKIITIECSTCEGTGWIEPAREEALSAGKALREKRKALDLSIREAAVLLKMGAADYSDTEFAKRNISAQQVRNVMALLVQRHKERDDAQ